MPTFKNITIPMRNGKTRLQRVQVLASGKYKFVKNLVKGKKTKGKSRSASKVSNVGNNKGKMFRTLGTKGALEDFAWGFGGLTLMGQGHVFNRTGKGRLVYALIDLVDLVIVGQASVQSIFDSIKQLTKIAPMA